MATLRPNHDGPRERVAHDHRHRRVVRHRRLLRPRAEGGRLARVRDGAQARGHRRARGRRHRSLLSRLSRARLDRGAGRRRSLARTGGTLDALFNNGAYAQAGAVEDLPVAALREQFEANFFGWHDLTRRIVPVMRAQGHRPHRPLLVDPRPGAGEVSRRLCASKHALEGLMLCMRAGTAGHRHPCLADRAGADRPRRSPPTACPGSSRTSTTKTPCIAIAYEAQLARLRAGGSDSRA